MDNLEQLKKENDDLKKKLAYKESFWGSMDCFWGPMGFFMGIVFILLAFGIEL